MCCKTATIPDPAVTEPGRHPGLATACHGLLLSARISPLLLLIWLLQHADQTLKKPSSTVPVLV